MDYNLIYESLKQKIYMTSTLRGDIKGKLSCTLLKLINGWKKSCAMLCKNFMNLWKQNIFTKFIWFTCIHKKN